MGKIEVVFTPDVIDFLDDLVRLLYKQEYFGFIETAEEYVSKIYDFIPENLRLNNNKVTPQKLRYLGSNYIFYKANNRTTWYIFFERQDSIFLITGISNNHCKEAKKL